ncbi:uncharacterized protein LOC122450875 [Cervus canadensis]|uniref:uncharacterized protein LOC122450875 n=1 Tax=Cervus canadensis TaxID=1574408 RepID=UPI001C9E443D|nr:uncharacterized protein LOC122450875 [Cervus canadensis]XP_043339160.1 uncharacterized protein LOC122450875 [Cervus canadensis]XP_043339161.1 uncharacterized protein LOC122450875 [Cervus canadensis]
MVEWLKTSRDVEMRQMEILKILEQYGIQTEKCAFQTVLWPTLGRTACGILVPRPGIEPVSPAVEALCLNNCTIRMPDQISVSEFIAETTEEYNSPTMSSFTTRLHNCSWRRLLIAGMKKFHAAVHGQVESAETLQVSWSGCGLYSCLGQCVEKQRRYFVD